MKGYYLLLLLFLISLFAVSAFAIIETSSNLFELRDKVKQCNENKDILETDYCQNILNNLENSETIKIYNPYYFGTW